MPIAHESHADHRRRAELLIKAQLQDDQQLFGGCLICGQPTRFKRVGFLDGLVLWMCAGCDLLGRG